MKEEIKDNYNDDVDLISLFKFFYKSIKDLFLNLFSILIKTLVYIRTFLISKFYYLLASLILGGIGGYIYSYVIPPVYETSLTIKSEFLRGFDFLYEIEKLNDYLVEKNDKLVAELFETESKNVEVLKGISADSYYNYHNIFARYGEIEKLDSLSVASEINSSLFVITIKMNSDALVLEKIEDWIFNFFNKNDLLERNYNIRKRNLSKMKIQLMNDLERLDSLKVSINQSIFKEDGQALSNLDINIKEGDDILQNTVKVYDRGWEAFTKLQVVEKELSLIEKITIVNGIKLIKENRKSFIKKWITIGVVVGPIIYIILFFLVGINKFLMNYEEAS